MTAGCVLISMLVLFTATTLGQSSEMCNDGLPRVWFGRNCSYACHCSSYDKCDSTNGTCGEDNCKPGYTGTSCQYVDSAYKAKVTGDLRAFALEEGFHKVVDGKWDPKDCFLEDGNSGEPLSIAINNPSFADVITVLLYKEFVEQDSAAKAIDLELKHFDDQDHPSGVLEPSKVEESGTLLTYLLKKPAVVSRVQIRARNNATLGICEISVSAGRNMALKMETLQSPKAAVDGNISTCFQPSGAFGVTLGESVEVWGIHVSSDTGPVTDLMVRLTLDTGTEAIAETRGIMGGQYIVLATPQRVKTVTLSANGALPRVCELAIYGDCPDGHFGWHCKERCQCKDNEACDKMLGYCRHRECQTGFTGDDCQTQCSPGYYGDKCMKTCSPHCNNRDCDHVTSSCLQGCEDGWTGSQCDRCVEGKGGSNCDMQEAKYESGAVSHRIACILVATAAAASAVAFYL